MTSFARIAATVGLLLVVAAPTLVHADGPAVIAHEYAARA